MKTRTIAVRTTVCVALALTLSFCGGKGEVQDGPEIDTVNRENLPNMHPGNPVDTIPADTIRTDTTQMK